MISNAITPIVLEVSLNRTNEKVVLPQFTRQAFPLGLGNGAIVSLPQIWDAALPAYQAGGPVNIVPETMLQLQKSLQGSSGLFTLHEKVESLPSLHVACKPLHEEITPS